MEKHVMYFSSSSSQTLKIGYDYIIKLNKPLEMGRSWSVGLIHARTPELDEDLFLCCDLVNHSIINGKRANVISAFSKNVAYHKVCHIVYRPMNGDSSKLYSFRVYILNCKGEKVSLDDWTVGLEFIKIKEDVTYDSVKLG